MDLEKKKFESFEIVDLVLNDTFKQLVYEKGDKNLCEYIENCAGHDKNIRLASKIVLGLQPQKQFQPLGLKYKLWKQIQVNHRRQRNFAILKYAAILIFFFSFGSGVFYWINQPLKIVELAESNPVDYEQFRLILPDRTEILLMGTDPIVESIDQGNTILLNDTVVVDQSLEGYNQVVVPYGRRGTVRLADGTQVNLNSGSRLVYPTKFSENKREVFLEGEGLFKVMKNERKPFFVQTNKFKVKVLGTTFNVQAYDKANLYNAVLVEGKVNLKLRNVIFPASVDLFPNQMASLSGNEEGIKVESVNNSADYTSWASGYLEFEDGSFEALLKRIEMYYNVQIEVKGKVRQLKISGKLDLMDNPESIIAGVSAMVKMKYRKEGEHNFSLYE